MLHYLYLCVTVCVHMCYTFRDHFFDTNEARRTKPKRKPSAISHPDAPPRGAQPVRQYHKTDEQKILPERRLGID